MTNLRKLASEVESAIPNIATKILKPKHDDIPRLSNFAATPGDEFWRVFPHLTLEKGKQIQSIINPIKLY